jgi:hypothetical protein
MFGKKPTKSETTIIRRYIETWLKNKQMPNWKVEPLRKNSKVFKGWKGITLKNCTR